ncbi:phosphatidylglycerophosphatase and protein-tyrosine phosphatase 1 isoform X1 [Silurus meridionalis]|nr:phosphatidylglycerophosphatase and protein-tyrosine phosphatase 1 isoform X1 [Silurus meridionalis]
MSGLLARVLFYPTLAYNVVLEKVSSRRWFDRVDQTVILGALPFKSMTTEVQKLLKELQVYICVLNLHTQNWAVSY